MVIRDRLHISAWDIMMTTIIPGQQEDSMLHLLFDHISPFMIWPFISSYLLTNYHLLSFEHLSPLSVITSNLTMWNSTVGRLNSWETEQLGASKIVRLDNRETRQPGDSIIHITMAVSARNYFNLFFKNFPTSASGMEYSGSERVKITHCENCTCIYNVILSVMFIWSHCLCKCT